MFAALAEPHRRRILELLRPGERTVGELVDELGLAQPTVSQHLKVLRDAGLVEVRADANRRLYRLRPVALGELDRWLQPFRELWADRLDALTLALDHPTTTDGGTPHAERPTTRNDPARRRTRRPAL